MATGPDVTGALAFVGALTLLTVALGLGHLDDLEEGPDMKAAALRLVNELPTIVVTVLLIAGVDQAEYEPVVEFAGAASAFLTWLLARRKLDGPVTVARSRRS